MSLNPEEPGIFSQTGRRQMVYSLIAVSVELSIGMAFGFAAVMQPQIAASGLEPSISEGAWLVSIVYLFLPVGNLINGFVMDNFGRRIAIIVGTVPLVAGWLYTGFANDILHIIIGRALTGFGCGMATAPPRVYVAEIALPNLRGVLAAFSPLSTSLGITIQGALGSLLPWNLSSFLCAGYTAGVFLISFLLPETPDFLMKKNRPPAQIERSLKKIRGDDYDIELELDKIEDFRHSHPVRYSCFGEIKALFTRSVCYPFFIIATFIMIAQMSGIAIMVQWTVTIINESNVSINSNVCNIVMSAARFFTLILVAVMIYHLRRKVLALVSSIGVGVSSLAIFLHLKFCPEPYAYPLVLYILYTFFSTVGFYALPFIIMTEIYPLKVRGLLGGLTLAYTNITSFLFTKLYPDVHGVIGLTYVFLVFSLSCFVGAALGTGGFTTAGPECLSNYLQFHTFSAPVFVNRPVGPEDIGSLFLYFFLPETKGLSLYEIEEIFGERRPLAASLHDMASRSMEAVNRSHMHLNN